MAQIVASMFYSIPSASFGPLGLQGQHASPGNLFKGIIVLVLPGLGFRGPIRGYT